MKTNPLPPNGARRQSRGFTLIELLTVITIIAILAALTVGAFSYAQQVAARSRSVSSLTLIKSALEQYHEKFGEYPDWHKPTDSGSSDQSASLSGYQYSITSAAMLYQAITGDGTDHLYLSSSQGSTTSQPSTGGIGASGAQLTAQQQNAIMPDLPKPMILNLQTSDSSSGGGTWVLVDGFGHPFQYVKALPPTGASGIANTINPNYDLWSYAQSTPTSMGSSSSSMPTDLATRQQSSNTWIKNWQ